MLAKIRIKVLEMKCNYYAKKSSYYYNKAVDYCINYEFDKADYCMNIAETYLIKHCGLTVQLMGLA